MDTGFVELAIDYIPAPLVSYPHYCRNKTDRIRWLAYKLGLTKRISPEDDVKEIPGMGYRLVVKEEALGEKFKENGE